MGPRRGEKTHANKQCLIMVRLELITFPCRFNRNFFLCIHFVLDSSDDDDVEVIDEEMESDAPDSEAQGSEADTDEDNTISPHEFDDVVEDTEPTETEPPETLPEGTVVLELDQDEVVADGGPYEVVATIDLNGSNTATCEWVSYLCICS